MTISQHDERERASLRRLHVIACCAVALATTAPIIATAAMFLGGARWMSLPRVAPFVVWAVVIAVNVAAWALTRYVLRRETSVAEDAASVEREQALRSGSVRGTMEVAESGSLGRRAATD